VVGAEVAHVQLLTPASGERHGLVIVHGRTPHRHRGGGLANRQLEQLGREPSRGWQQAGRAAAGGGGVQAQDGVEVDRAASLVLGHLRKRHPHQPPHLALRESRELGQGAVQVDRGP
jgi:hypothetical protein